MPDMPQSSAYIVLKAQGTALRFTGVTEITHRLGLKIFDKADVTEAASFVNGAKNEPDRVTLSVTETDAAHEAAGWSARMLEILYSVKRNRMLCRVVTPQKTYEDMLLSEISATHNAENPDGWSGEITFTEYIPSAIPGENRQNDNGSTPKNTGSAAPPRTVTAAAAFGQAAQTISSTAGLVTGFASLGLGSALQRKLAAAGLLEGGNVLYIAQVREKGENP